MNKFSDFSLCSELQNNLRRHGFETPTPVQAGTIPAALEGRDVVATAQTGTGKTLAFLLPMMEMLNARPDSRKVEGVILTPTRELAIQIGAALEQLNHGLRLRPAVVVGGVNENTQLRALRNGARIVIATPGRLCDFLNRKLIDLSGVRMFVLDEADRMLDMGFLPALKVILKGVPESRQTLFFSATIEKSVAHLIESHVTNPVRVAIGAVTAPASQVDLHLYEVQAEQKMPLLIQLLEREQGSFLVFARTKHGTDRLAKNLVRFGVKAARIHGDRTQNQRNQALSGFKDGQYRVLVATDVAARGIHVEGIAHVVNYDLPQVPEDFIHRVGRTGRAGARGVASTFAQKAERGEIRKIERALKTRLTPQTVEVEELPAPKVVTIPRPVHAKSTRFSPNKRRQRSGTR